MMRGKYFGMVIMLLFVFVTLLAPNAARGTVNETRTGTGTDSFNNVWTAVSTAVEGACTDNKGNPISSGILYSYDLSVADSNGNPIPPPGVNQTNVDYDLACPGEWTVLYPTDKSLKSLLCDPSSKFRCDDVTRGVFAWSAQKVYPDDHYRFSMCVDGGIPKDAHMLVESDAGDVLIYPSLSPGCCTTQSTTQTTTLIGATGTSLIVNSELCSLEPTTVSVQGGTGPEPIYPIPGLVHCSEGSNGSIARNTCADITKFGPENGLFVVTKFDPACTPDANTNCPGIGYYGWGGKVYAFDLDNVPDPDPLTACDTSGLFNVPRRGGLVVDDLVEFVYDGCGGGSIYDTDGNLLAGPTTTNTPLWLIQKDDSGKLILSTAGILVSGSSEGVVFEGSYCGIIAGKYKCF